MKTALIIHGHFYQPPREDPSTGIVPLQASAKPYTNWNEAIFKTCYEPNAFSRYLSGNGKIAAIYNNYSSISLNYGPTLLSWIDETHPDFAEKLKEADRESLSKWGHSNFLAQTYNHTILPLDNNDNRKIQINWALTDYFKRFGHNPEGFWCAECAINKDVVDNLAESGIKFVILSPWQAESINGIKLNGKCAPSDRPFVLEGNRYTISAFFYNPDYASGISFGHLLRDADKLYNNLVDYKKHNQNLPLLSWATDGEIYGHHEAFGDMALAALIKKVNEGDLFYLTNYAAYLETHKPTDTAQLWLGEDGLGSSWSCSHGVKRWYTDCGCHTGGDEKWNQKWRTHLRTALQNLEQKAKAFFDTKMESLFGQDVQTQLILENYGKVLSGESTVSQFIERLEKKYNRTLSDEDKEFTASMLDCIKNILFSFTSCGWFFNDISGIEPSQNISYAVYAATLLQKYTNVSVLNSLVKELHSAKSNIESEGNGETIARTFINIIPSAARACGYYLLKNYLFQDKIQHGNYGFFNLIGIEKNTITVKNNRTLENSSFFYTTELKENGLLYFTLKNVSTGFSYSFNSANYSVNTLQEFSSLIEKKLESLIDFETVLSISENIENYLILANSNKQVAKENIFAENISLCLRSLSSDALLTANIPWDKKLYHICKLVHFIALAGTSDNKKSLEKIITDIINGYAENLYDNRECNDSARKLLDILKTARLENLNIDITNVQNKVWDIIRKNNDSENTTVFSLKQELNFVL